MKTQGGFTLLENEKDVKNWLAKQKVSRRITRLQVHHMDMPSYSTWEKTDKKVFSEPHFGRTKSLDSYGKSKWGSAASDGHGHHIAQHFNVFPDGKITTGRNLNSTPIGIRGWNDHAICIEIYGCFDKGHDKMSDAQKKAVIYLYGLLSKRFDIPVNTTHIRPHCWFTYSGTYLGKYNVDRSAKTCPGTNFMGFGTSPEGFAHFIKDVKNYVDGKKAEPKKEETKATKFEIVTLDKLNIRKVADWDADPVATVKKGQHLQVIDTVGAKNGNTSMYRLESGLYITASDKYVKKV
jgi:hypothetical protein|nr:MAG TPA: N-acetylmuramoyl-L-alanine amidase [Caudoviricetes sp.]